MAKGFIEVTDQYQNKKVLLPIDKICFIRERGDGCAIINFEMCACQRPDNDFESAVLVERISDITTVETYGEVIAKIKKALR